MGAVADDAAVDDEPLAFAALGTGAGVADDRCGGLGNGLGMTELIGIVGVLGGLGVGTLDSATRVCPDWQRVA